MPYEWLKALHIIAIISWMAGMLYLPRLFVYHVAAPAGSPWSETLKIMERRLLRFIINPAMLASYIFGIWMLIENPGLLRLPSMHVKFTALFFMQIAHAMLARHRKAFAADHNKHSEKYFRILNEVPTILMIIIVIMATVHPSFQM